MNELIASTSASALQMANSKITNKGTEKYLSVNRALALYIDLNLSTRKYKVLSSVINSVHKDCLPSYYAISNAKKSYRPDGIVASETFAEVPLQNILNITAKSLIHLNNITTKNIILECKWGFDGSSGHSIYKQKSNDPDLNEEFLFVVAFVPLIIKNETDNSILWKNNKHSSTRFCRPIKFLSIKENPSLVKSVHQSISTEIENLTIYCYENAGVKINVNFKMNLTMIDGAVVNILTNNKSASCCFMCGAKPTEMNREKSIYNKEIKDEHLKYGLSTLHALIKCFECLLHIGYKLPLKTWRVAGDEKKKKLSENKLRIQREFKNQMGLNIDKVKHGYGTTNDGNTARAFFSNVDVASNITGVDSNLINKFSLILKTLSSGMRINNNNFEKLLKETTTLYLNLYPWYYMPVTVHKILIHGMEFLKHSTLPIGVLSEEALESMHKIIRKARLEHTRKCGREKCNKDLMLHLILQSEPSISIYSKIDKRKQHSLEEIKEFVIQDKCQTEDNYDNFIDESLLEISSSESDEESSLSD